MPHSQGSDRSKLEGGCPAQRGTFPGGCAGSWAWKEGNISHCFLQLVLYCYPSHTKRSVCWWDLKLFLESSEHLLAPPIIASTQWSQCSEGFSSQEEEIPSTSQVLGVPQLLLLIYYINMIVILQISCSSSFKICNSSPMQTSLNNVEQDFQDYFPLIFREPWQCECLLWHWSERRTPWSLHDLVSAMSLTYDVMLGDRSGHGQEWTPDNHPVCHLHEGQLCQWGGHLGSPECDKGADLVEASQLWGAWEVHLKSSIWNTSRCSTVILLATSPVRSSKMKAQEIFARTSGGDSRSTCFNMKNMWEINKRQKIQRDSQVHWGSRCIQGTGDTPEPYY